MKKRSEYTPLKVAVTLPNLTFDIYKTKARQNIKQIYNVVVQFPLFLPLDHFISINLASHQLLGLYGIYINRYRPLPMRTETATF